jgi:hypothetical protein
MNIVFCLFGPNNVSGKETKLVMTIIKRNEKKKKCEKEAFQNQECFIRHSWLNPPKPRIQFRAKFKTKEVGMKKKN